jgi:hypothetical protein
MILPCFIAITSFSHAKHQIENLHSLYVLAAKFTFQLTISQSELLRYSGGLVSLRGVWYVYWALSTKFM